MSDDKATPRDAFGEAIRAAADKLRNRELGCIDDAIAALITAGAKLDEIEVLHFPYGQRGDSRQFTIVRKRRS